MKGKKGGKAKRLAASVSAVRKGAQKALKKAVKDVKQKVSSSPAFVRDVEPEFSFWLCDGRVVRNTAQLADAAATMSDDTYSFHANERKNDFADWIRDIIKDEALAYSVRKAKDRKEMESAIKNSINGKSSVPAEAPEKAVQNAIRTKDEKTQTYKIVPSPELKPVQKAVATEKIIQNKVKTHRIKMHKSLATKAKIEQKTAIKKEEKIKADSVLEKLRKKEEELLKDESNLAADEERLNNERIELTRKRYELLKARGELEKEMFEHFMSRKEIVRHVLPQMPLDTAAKAALVELGNEKISALISEIKDNVAQGNVEEAAKKYLEATEIFSRSPINPDDKRALKFRLMETEADIKLASLKPVQMG